MCSYFGIGVILIILGMCVLPTPVGILGMVMIFAGWRLIIASSQMK